MPRVEFDALPEDARLWIFAADRDLAGDEQRELLRHVDDFLDQWAAHGVPLTAARDLRYDRFLFVAVDEKAAGASGCSIDAMVHGLRDLQRRMDVTLIDHGPVLYRDNGEIRRVPRHEFQELASQGAVTERTVVFNNMLTTVGDVRGGRWEVSAGQSWHAKAFFGK